MDFGARTLSDFELANKRKRGQPGISTNSIFGYFTIACITWLTSRSSGTS
jgi:hypothetical protein